MIVGKIIEVVIEALPAGILQAYALMRSERPTKTAVLSLFTACSSVAFTSASLSFDLDTSPNKRKDSPTFYGYVKDSPRARSATFLCMFLLTLSHLASKFFAIALLASIRRSWVTFYLGGDVVSYLAYKAVRCDLRYQLNLPRALSILASFNQRVLSKIMADFTCVVHFRHPADLGGVYWCMNLVMSQASCFVAAKLYIDHTAGETGSLSQDTITTLLGTSFALWMFSFTGFFASIDKAYLHTFYDIASGKQHVVRSFRNATSDEDRIQVFKRHPSFYRSIADEIKCWVAANYREVWLEEKPEWLTDRVLALIPKEMIPKEEREAITKVEEEEVGGSGAKRVSIVEGLLGAPPRSSYSGGNKAEEGGGTTLPGGCR